MNIHDLYAFKSVVKNGSLSKAALELNYAQSNITMKIQSLEKLYNTQLFYRHNRGITLTPKGELLFEEVNKMIQLYEDTLKMMGDSEKASGPLRIGSMETTAAIHLPPLLTKFHMENPDVDIVISTGPTRENIKKVEDYELDGAFVAGPISHSHLQSTKLIVEELVLVTSFMHAPIHSLENLADCTLIVFRNGCSYRALFEQWLQMDGIIPRKVMELGTLDGLLGCVSAGLGASLLPLSVVKKQAKYHQIQYHRIHEKQSLIPTLFLYRKDEYQSKALAHFLNVIESYHY
ncbi:LysR family transcriptional regulator [Bacillus sp. Bva_UNVM-123]|uniref:LysR family transcriptional regulator n=1 Tax=Bacillus sp. Bva_UNVM-123 TaxID=2829798 RepID=UPI00391F0A2D